MSDRSIATRPLAACLSCVLVTGACLDTKQAPVDDSSVAISVAPLALEGVDEASYTITVEAGGQVVWSRSNVLSSQYGDGRGAIAYVGPCDASAGTNTVTLTLDGLWADGVPIEGTYRNPTPVAREITCEPNADAEVVFNLTVLRSAEQGFFDIGVTFTDIFCSAKLDCADEGGRPLELLFDDEGDRVPSVVLAFACTAGPGQSTWLYLSDLMIQCAGDAEPYPIDPTAGPGKLTLAAPPDGVVAASTYRDNEALTDVDKCYWNTAIGLDLDALGDDCTITAYGTAAAGALGGNQTAPWTRYPFVRWQVQLTDEGGELACDRHALDAGDGVVATDYTTYAASGMTFAHGCACATGACETATPCGNGALDPGEQCDGGANCVACACVEGAIPSGDGSSCSLCGNTILDEGEDCDGSVGCQSDCTCDGGYDADGEGLCGMCGDGSLQSDLEECDGDMNCDAGTCECLGDYGADPTGVCDYCGDGELQLSLEDCDGGVNCGPSCTCENGYGVTPTGDGCESCGDGMVNGMSEECDASDDPNCDACTCAGMYDFEPETGNCGACGDAVLQSGAGEQCDDGLDSGGNCFECGCDGGYEPSPDGGCGYCGDENVDIGAGEECEQFHDMGGNCSECGCDGGYEPSPDGGCGYCGDETVDIGAGEECEQFYDMGGNCSECGCDGGYEPSPDGGCGYCGDETVDIGAGEECEQFYDVGGNCFECGCDGGYDPSPDGGCGYCGDGLLDVGAAEECDGVDGCVPGGCYCDSGYTSDGFGNCMPDEVCGDGTWTEGEECDGGDGCDPEGCTCPSGWPADGEGGCLDPDGHVEVFVSGDLDGDGDADLSDFAIAVGPPPLFGLGGMVEMHRDGGFWTGQTSPDGYAPFDLAAPGCYTIVIPFGAVIASSVDGVFGTTEICVGHGTQHTVVLTVEAY